MPRLQLDVARFSSIVDSAIQAFGRDLGYAEAMLRSAAAIEKKRSVWELRLSLRDREQKAQRLCSQFSFTCDALSPCGFGDCRFAEPGALVVVSTRGAQQRPQPSSHYRDYDRELAVKAALAV